LETIVDIDVAGEKVKFYVIIWVNDWRSEMKNLYVLKVVY
jgi:hypothetical protein